MTTTLIILIACFAVLIIAIRAAFKYRNKGESKLSVYEHPSTFKKPEIEMVNPVSQKQYDLTTTTDIPSMHIKDETENDQG
jgi:hypothetical protein